MPAEPSSRAVAARRLLAQRLTGEPFDRPIDAVRSLLAVQSQDYAGAKWALGQRSAGAPTDADLDALFDSGAIVRTHVMRPTWHFVAAEDLRWLLALTAPRVHLASAYQYRILRIDPPLAARAIDVIARTLEGGRSLTRPELGAALAAAGIDAGGLRLGYFASYAELEGVICSGPRRGRQQTYALVDERVPPSRPRERDEALAELATRYVQGHGPAQDVDLAWWSGLTLRDARRALQAAGPALTTETIDDRTFWVDREEWQGRTQGRTLRAAAPPAVPAAPAAPAAAPRTIHLLPNYDELLIAFRDRRDAADPDLPASARVAETILAPVITRDGLVIGGWKRRETPRAIAIELSPLVRLAVADRAALRVAIDRLAMFLGRPVEIAGLD